MPVTEKTPFFSVIVPSEVVPSPQVIVAVKSAVVASGLASVNVATVAVTVLPSVALTSTPVAVSPAVAISMFIVAALAEVVPPSLSVTLNWNEPELRSLVVGTKVNLPLVMSAAETT